MRPQSEVPVSKHGRARHAQVSVSGEFPPPTATFSSPNGHLFFSPPTATSSFFLFAWEFMVGFTFSLVVLRVVWGCGFPATGPGRLCPSCVSLLLLIALFFD